jgi:heat-inducible transcriptional repressor
MELNDRKIKILKAIVSSYIHEGEAIGSRTISKKYDLGISSATVRNEMSDLEELGFLAQPHTSAGRVPTDKAYRLYVDKLIRNNSKNKYNAQIKKILQEEIDEMEKFIRNSARILSQFTKYTSFAMTPQLKESKLKRIQLVPITENKMLMVLVTENNLIKNVILNIKIPVPAEQLNQISNLLTEKLGGRQLKSLDKNLYNHILKEIYSIRESFDEKFDEVFILLLNTMKQYEKVDVYYDGLTNILNYPEYNDTGKAKELLSFMEDRKAMASVLMDETGEDLAVSIGHENKFDEIKQCSVISATYKLNGVTIGKIGLIGPTRMDYKNVISMVKALSLNVNRLIEENYIDIARSDTDE